LELLDLPVRIRIYPTVPIIPINTFAITIVLTSPFIIWVNSCQATASISFLSNFSINHFENTTQEFFSLQPVAKAFILPSSIIPIFGIGKPLLIQRFSTIL
jgi:hypothetical protein